MFDEEQDDESQDEQKDEEELIMPDGFGNFATYHATYANMKPPEPKNENILFYGFNGILAQKYSVIKDKSVEEIQSMMNLVTDGKKIPWMIRSSSNFYSLINQFMNTPNELTEIPLQDAMNIIRIGTQQDTPEVFDDAEEDEFTDTCQSTCKPGEHTCGK